MSDNHSLRISSTIKAPRTKVYAAWTTPDILAKWFAPGLARHLPKFSMCARAADFALS